MSIFGMTSVVGIALGPFIGGAIQTNQDPLNWHWIFWIQLIVCGGLLPVFWFLLRETRGDVILMKKAKKIRKETGRDVYAKAELDKTSILTNVKVSFLRPTKMLVTEFVVISFTLWVSFGKSRQLSFRLLAKFQLGDSSSSSSPVSPKRSGKSESQPPSYAEVSYGFNTFQTSLIQLALSVGAIIGTIINPFQDRLYLSSGHKNKKQPGKPVPEARLYFSIPGSLLFTAGLFWYGWSSYPHVHFMVPTLAIGLIGLGIYSIYMATGKQF
jgi:hypothetical protein